MLEETPQAEQEQRAILFGVKEEVVLSPLPACTDKIIEIIQEQVGSVKLHNRFVKDLAADQYDMDEIFYELEIEFNLNIPDKDRVGFVRVQDVVDYIEGRCNA